ncbi:Protein CBG04334 [Caenorhabditis briggsae]|uniref:Protein CBG04334 n=1 Tax=Caenorhabditis briggsae TaxID=6238 RepID=A8WXA5_CAEBR|nr:Protein CBG04334 [Caenorhabditis briggsae]CAP25066.2 Protein CBG04334 [Caenorhabditis briggsae]
MRRKMKFCALLHIDEQIQEFERNSSKIPENSTRNVCETPECVNLAHELLNWRDKTVNPCDNFYKASCGNYIELEITDGTRNTKKGKVIKRLIKEILVKNHETESKSENTMKQLYWKCEDLKNKTIFNSQYNKMMKEIFRDIQFVGPSPIFNSKWKPSMFDLNKMLSNLAKLGHYNFGLYKLTKRQGWDMVLETDYEGVQHSGEQKMFQIISAILEANQIKFNESSIHEDLRNVHEFYEELKVNSSGWNKLAKIAPNIQFETILKNLLHPKNGNWTMLRPKILNAEAVFEKFSLNRTNTNGTLSKILANYLVLRFIKNSYSSISYTATVASNRACDDLVIHNLPRATLRAFVQHHFDRENLKIVSEMLEKTRHTYLEIIGNTTWLSEEGKKRASLKIEKIKKLVGYPDEYNKKGALDETFETLDTKKTDSFYTLMKKIKKYRAEILMDFIAFNKTLDPNKELFTVNAFYSAALNQLSIMVPFIDEPNMDSSYPVYAKYAVTGDILGHEMGHSMDTLGIQWNEFGEYERWMPEEDEKKYKKRIQCLRDQYEHYDDPDFGKHNLRISESQNLRISESQNLRISESQNLRISESQNLRISESQNLRISESQNLRISESQNLRISESQNLRISENLKKKEFQKTSKRKNFRISEFQFFQLDSSKVINEIIADRHGIDAAIQTYRSLKLQNEPKIIGFENESPEKMMFRILALKNYQNTSVEPCEDFFEHSCGRLHEHMLEDSNWGYSQFRMLMYQVFCEFFFRFFSLKIFKKKIPAIIRKTKKFTSRPKEQLRIFAKKCLDRGAMNKDNLEGLRKDIQMRGGFPMIDSNWDESKFDLSEMLSKYLSINRNRMGFLSVEPFTTVENGTVVNMLYVGPGPQYVYNYAMSIGIYKDSVAFILERLLKLENRTLNRTEYEEEFQKLVDLEERFANVSCQFFSEKLKNSKFQLADYKNLNLDNDNMSKAKNLSDLAKMIPEIDWYKIMRALPRQKMTSEEEKKFFSKIRVHGGGEYFFGEKRELAQIAITTPKTVLANYLVVRQIIDVALYYYDKDQPRQGKFYNHENQQVFCVDQLAFFFPMPSMNVFIETSGYKMENLKIIERIFKEIKLEYTQLFQENQWLEPKIREFFIRKLNAISGKFGFQEYIEGQPLLEKMYQTVSLDFLETDTPYQIYMKMWRHRTEQVVEHIMYNTPLNPVNLRQFALYAAYNSYGNVFNINLAYLTYPWFDADFPSYSNYGYLGYVIGHEIGHAFDHFHRKLDENGIQHKFWLTETNSSNIEYNKREKCLRDQYSSYKEPGYDFFMNGTVTRYEIVGDHLGLRTAYRIFKKAENLDTVKLPGFDDVSPDQMFFYSYALRQCDIYNPTIRPEYLKGRPHPTSRFRVNGVIQNLPEFSEAFNCPKTAAMNLKNKCTLF